MSAARIDSDGNVTQLDGRAEPDEVVTEADVTDAAKLARVVGRLLAEVAALRRAWAPMTIDFEDVPVLAAGGTVTLQHNMGGRVRWFVVGCSSTITSAADNAATTDDTLVLDVTSAANGTATIRIQAAG